MSVTTINSALLTATTPVALVQNSNVAQLDRIGYVDITAVIAGANPANIVFTAAITDICTTATAHGFTTGIKVRFTTTTTLPAGLALATDYYLTVLSATTFKVSASQADVTSGTYVDITDTGTGVHTVAVVTTLAGTIKLQKTNDRVDNTSPTWVDLVDAEVTTVTASQSFAAAGTKNWLVKQFSARALRVVITVTSGTVTTVIQLHGKQI